MPEPPKIEGAAGWLAAVKGLSLTNALVILVLVVALVPAYAAYRLLTDEALLDRFLAAYQVLPTSTACRLLRARQRGEDYSYAITTGFAFEGQQRWTIGVVLNHMPSDEEMQTNCLLLQTIIDFMHGIAPPPDIIWQQKDVGKR